MVTIAVPLALNWGSAEPTGHEALARENPGCRVHESAFGTKRTFAFLQLMSASG
jgi:hypothetical protein